jgi:hypothetical protein
MGKMGEKWVKNGKMKNGGQSTNLDSQQIVSWRDLES